MALSLTQNLTARHKIRVIFGLTSMIPLAVSSFIIITESIRLGMDGWILLGLSLLLALLGFELMSVTFEDVRGRRQLDDMLIRSEEKYRNLFQQSNDAIIMHDLAGHIIDANEKAFSLFDSSKSDFLTATISDLHPAEALQTSKWAFSTVERDRFVQFEIPFRKRNGDTFVAEVSSSLFEAGGKRLIQGIIRDITERKKSEQTLREIEERYQALYNRSLYGVFVHDFDGAFLDANEAALQMVGYTRAEITQVHLSSLMDEAQVRRAFQKIESLKLHGREEKPVEYTLRRKDGSCVWAETESSIIYRGGKPFAVQGVIRDVTRHKQIMEALQAAEERFRTLFEDAVIGLYRTTPGGKMLMANPTFVRMLGYASFDELAQMNMETEGFEPEYQRAAFQERIEREGQIVGLESTWKRRDGTEIHVRENARCTRNAAGQVVYYEGTVEDISERKQAERAIRESEEKYRNLIDQSRDGIYLLYEGKFEIINKRFEELFGYSQDETNAPSFNFMDLISPKSRPFVEERSKKVDRGETVSPQYQFTAVTRDGREIEVETSVSYIQYKGGIATQGVLRDITERVKAEQALRTYAQDLQRSNQDLEQFAYISSHDLQEPLRMVASYLQLLERRYADRLDADAREFINYAVNGAVRMQRLINDLLAYSRVGTRGKSFEVTRCEKVLELALLDLTVAIEERGASITHEPLPVLRADATQLGQVFQNLIGNAIKFCEGRPPQIHVRAEQREEEWIFSVRDNGIGFDEKYSDRIFKIFQRLHTREEYPGTGAGLAICKKIVERHGGRIWAASTPGQGSTFFFTIPVEGGLPDERPADRQAY